MLLSAAEEVTHAAVIVILRGRKKLGSTAIGVFERYTKALQERDSRLYLAEVGEPVREQLEKTGALQVIGEDYVFPAGELLMASLQNVYNQAQIWLEETPDSNDNSQY